MVPQSNLLFLRMCTTKAHGCGVSDVVVHRGVRLAPRNPWWYGWPELYLRTQKGRRKIHQTNPHTWVAYLPLPLIAAAQCPTAPLPALFYSFINALGVGAFIKRHLFPVLLLSLSRNANLSSPVTIRRLRKSIFTFQCHSGKALGLGELSRQ